MRIIKKKMLQIGISLYEKLKSKRLPSHVIIMPNPVVNQALFDK